nr:unnamed protein product [Callosobruchus analis]
MLCRRCSTLEYKTHCTARCYQ